MKLKLHLEKTLIPIDSYNNFFFFFKKDTYQASARVYINTIEHLPRELLKNVTITFEESFMTIPDKTVFSPMHFCLHQARQLKTRIFLSMSLVL